MRIGELAAKSATTIKAVRYYEQLGLVTPARHINGYRPYSDHDLKIVQEIRELAGHGITPAKARPFIECLDAGHRHSDECPASLAAYRDSLAELDRAIASLTARRSLLAARLQQGAARTFTLEPDMTDYATTLPDNLPIPADDGAAAHLPGLKMPALVLEDTSGRSINLADLGTGRSIIYLYPLTGVPGTDLPDGWDAIPGARGCSTEACDFRDHFAQLQAAGVERVHGLSSQGPDYQREVTARLRLPFTMLSDTGFELAAALTLPTFAAPGHPRLYSRLTLVATAGVIEHVFYPIFPPNTHAQQVLAWLEANPAS